MSVNKKYYYLKLKDSFFDSEEMKLLESQKNAIEIIKCGFGAFSIKKFNK